MTTATWRTVRGRKWVGAAQLRQSADKGRGRGGRGEAEAKSPLTGGQCLHLKVGTGNISKDSATNRNHSINQKHYSTESSEIITP